MPSLFIRDESVNELASEAMRLTGASSKTEVVRAALQTVIAQAKGRVPLSERLRSLQDQAERLGPVDANFDQKAFMDEMWGD